MAEQQTCTNCGGQLPSGALFCTQCGTRFSTPLQLGPADDPTRVVTPQADATQTLPAATPAPPSARPRRRPHRRLHPRRARGGNPRRPPPAPAGASPMRRPALPSQRPRRRHRRRRSVPRTDADHSGATGRASPPPPQAATRRRRHRRPRRQHPRRLTWRHPDRPTRRNRHRRPCRWPPRSAGVGSRRCLPCSVARRSSPALSCPGIGRTCPTARSRR